MTIDQQTRTAVSATLHCLTGCAIGEILGLALATWWGWSNGPSIALAFVLAFVFGYSFTVVPVLRSGLTLRRAIAVALVADTVSILTMELVDNGVVLAVPGAMDAGLGDALFWWSLALSLTIAFAVTVPVNRWLISRGRGHAVVHALHAGHATGTDTHLGEHAQHQHAGH
ncbi:MAG TPA: DUF4396 domain-containing protein [Candidatus Nanopelagicales bacterium]|nr:DUF4396 domain-containing protein [Candidatus Nanopelagicales bacterium]